MYSEHFYEVFDVSWHIYSYQSTIIIVFEEPEIFYDDRLI